MSAGGRGDPYSMIDDDVATYFEFDTSASEHFVLLDLGSVFAANSFSMVMPEVAGTLRAYAFNAVPEELVEGDEVAGGTGQARELFVPREFLEDNEPQIFAEVEQPVSRLQLSIGEFEYRYLLVRWTADLSLAPIDSFRIYEISVVGDIPEPLGTIAYVTRAEFLQAAAPAPASVPDPQPDPSFFSN